LFENESLLGHDIAGNNINTKRKSANIWPGCDCMLKILWVENVTEHVLNCSILEIHVTVKLTLCEMIKTWTLRVYNTMWRVPSLSDGLPIVFCSSVLLKSQALSHSYNLIFKLPSREVSWNNSVAEYYNCQVSHRGQQQWPRMYQLNGWRQIGIHTYAYNSFWIISYSDLLFVKAEHNITCKTYCVWPHSAAWEVIVLDWWCVYVRKISSKEDERQETDVRSESNAIYAVDCQEVLHGPSVGIIQFCCNFSWTSPRLSFHVCNYGVFLSGVCTDLVRLTFRWCYT
jgi:hypothetical protein